MISHHFTFYDSILQLGTLSYMLSNLSEYIYLTLPVILKTLLVIIFYNNSNNNNNSTWY